MRLNDKHISWFFAAAFVWLLFGLTWSVLPGRVQVDRHFAGNFDPGQVSAREIARIDDPTEKESTAPQVRGSGGHAAGLITRTPEIEDILSKIKYRRYESTDLHRAAKEGDLTRVKSLLAFGADIEALDASRRSPLFVAVENGKTRVVDLLIKAGADVNTADRWGTPALVAAAQGKHALIAHLLLEAGARVDARCKRYNLTALQMAAQQGSREIVEECIKHGADVNATAFIGMTALDLARDEDHTEIVSLLIANGATPAPAAGD